MFFFSLISIYSQAKGLIILILNFLDGRRLEIRGTVETKTAVFTEGEAIDDNPDELIVGKTSGTGVKMSVIKFDLSEIQALHYDKVCD